MHLSAGGYRWQHRFALNNSITLGAVSATLLEPLVLLVTLGLCSMKSQAFFKKLIFGAMHHILL